MGKQLRVPVEVTVDREESVAVHITVWAKFDKNLAVFILFEGAHASAVHSKVVELLKKKGDDYPFYGARSAFLGYDIRMGIYDDGPVLDIKESILHPVLDIVTAAMMSLKIVNSKSEMPYAIDLTWGPWSYKECGIFDLVRKFSAAGD